MKSKIRDKRANNRFYLDNQYLNGYARLMKPFATLVYISLCRHANNETQECFPGMKLISEECGISEKTVERSVKELEKWQIVEVNRVRKESGAKQNIYTLLDKEMWLKKPTDSQSVGTNLQTHSPNPTDSQGVSLQTPVPYNNTNITILSNKTQKEQLPTKVGEVFSFEKESAKLLNPPLNETCRIVHWYITVSKTTCKTKQEWVKVKARLFSEASVLTGYTNEQLESLAGYFDEKKLSWRLSTLSKNTNLLNL